MKHDSQRHVTELVTHSIYVIHKCNYLYIKIKTRQSNLTENIKIMSNFDTLPWCSLMKYFVSSGLGTRHPHICSDFVKGAVYSYCLSVWWYYINFIFILQTNFFISKFVYQLFFAFREGRKISNRQQNRK